jgi:nitrilase
MKNTSRIAALQMCSGVDLEKNWQAAELGIKQAAEQGCQLIVLPENFAVFDAAQYRDVAVRLPELLERLSRLAQQAGVWIVAGTLPTASRPDGVPVPDRRVRASCHVIDAQGSIVARYDKIHLFDVAVADAQGSYQESASFEPGDAVVCVDTPVGRLGLTVCYDLRFPELFRALLDQGAELISVPAAFTGVTGEAHWQVLLRARAIENQCYIIGAAQGGRHSPTRQTWGHSQIIDPWGRVLAERQEQGLGLIWAERDAAFQADLKQRMPIQQHRRILR